MLLTIILIFTALIFIETIAAARQKLWRDFTSLIVLTAFSICFSIFKMVDIPTPIILLKELFFPIGRAVFRNH